MWFLKISYVTYLDHDLDLNFPPSRPLLVVDPLENGTSLFLAILLSNVL